MNIFKVISAVLQEPTAFFKKVGEGKNNLGFAFGYFALLSFVRALFGIFVFFFITERFLTKFLPSLAGLDSNPVVSVVVWFAFGLGLSFVYAGLLHAWILLFGGKHNYVKTYELGAYAGTPSLLFGWIPFGGGLIGFIWSLVLLIIGTQQVHGISRTRAIWMYLVPLIILAVLSIALLAVAFMFIASSGILPEIIPMLK